MGDYGKYIGSNIARYAEEKARKKHQQFKEHKYFCSLSPSRQREILENKKWQREFEENFFGR